MSRIKKPLNPTQRKIAGIGMLRATLAIYEQVKEMRGKRQKLAEQCMDAFHDGDRKRAETLYHKYLSNYTEI